MLNLPSFDVKIRRGDNILKIFDSLRKKYIDLTPEEFVRQHFVNWLIYHLHYPLSLMANEIGIDLNGTKRRCDTVVFNSDGTPLIIIEYKAPNIKITQKVFDQIVRYNMVLHARYLIVSNGIQHFCCMIDYLNNTYNFIPRIPCYKELKSI
ncbi:MAG: type I restriction enzyme HsdR N-terminal domain-containing protein [Bacteroides sp.]|nr:type I restriction enzyme HsdR N-terminal domain-containing protein [Bacteroides sp.]